MQQVADWLEKLGLGQYAQRFAENDISFVILPDLTDQDLEKIGVVSLGHRRLLLRAIAELGDAGKAVQRTAASDAMARDTAERRQVTVMFSDLVGSTALSARMDPEDLREIISAYQKCVAQVVQRFGGFVAKYMGDGVLVYFGYPRAHEDDAERAVRAGLELILAVGGLKASAPLQTRVGIATGLVVVGDLIGSGAAQEQTVVGETPNLASRLQGIAEPNTIVIAESTRRLLGNLFELEDLGAKDLKGITEPARTWRALRASSVASRFEALHATGLTELVGREEELDLLLRRWSKAKTSEGQVVLLSGEAGIGKSRLTAALMERLEGEPHTRLRYFCSPQHTDSALYPVIGQMERAAGLAHGDTAQVKFDKLDALLAQTSTSAQDVSLFADMLSLPNDGRYPTLDMTPEQRRLKTLEALGGQMEALSRSNPVLMIFEDAHWTDPTSLEAFSRVVDQLRNLRVLLIVTFRPEFDPPWIGRPYVTALTINRLTQRDIETVIDNVVGNKLFPASIRQDIIERTDGIPLFVEEMTKAVLEAGSEGAAQQQTVASFPSPALAVPASLQASLMARLDRLGPAKEVAQVGAAIGREFSHALLGAVVRKPEAELQSALDRLVATGLLFRQGVPPQASYLFKHALVQDAAYGTLLREPRRALHARIAETLEGQFTEIAENQPELLARHCSEAGLIEKAASLWGKAGQRSLARSALVEATEQLSRAIDQTAKLPPTPSTRRQEIALQVALIGPLHHTKGHSAPETKAAVERALLLIKQAEAAGEAPDDPMVPFIVLYGIWASKITSFQDAICLDLANQFLRLAEKDGGSVPLVLGHGQMGISLLYAGRILEARTSFDQSLRLYAPAKDRRLGLRFGNDPGLAALMFRAQAAWVLGYPKSALADARNALDIAREIEHAATLMIALRVTNSIYLYTGDLATAEASADELAFLAHQKGSLVWKSGAMTTQAQILALTGRPAEALRILTEGAAIRRATGQTLFGPLLLSVSANISGMMGQFDEAWQSIGEAVKTTEVTGERWYEAEVNRIAGEIALKSSNRNTVKAYEYFDRALAVARQQQAKSWELRAAMSMARLWRDQGKRDEARDLLAPVYGWFTEGFDTLDLKEAKALLDEL
jgi:class 3 adenylate cyclase/predicted ATPase